jgi:hypothetical protein
MGKRCGTSQQITLFREWVDSDCKYHGPPVPTGQGAGWASELVWTQRLQENPFASARDWTEDAQSSSPWQDTLLTELHYNDGGPNEERRFTACENDLQSLTIQCRSEAHFAVCYNHFNYYKRPMHCTHSYSKYFLCRLTMTHHWTRM